MTEEKFLKRLELIKRLQNDKIIDKQEAELLLEYEKEDLASSLSTSLIDKMKVAVLESQKAQEQYYKSYNQKTIGNYTYTQPTSAADSSTSLQAFQKGLLNGNNLGFYTRSLGMQIPYPNMTISEYVDGTGD